MPKILKNEAEALAAAHEFASAIAPGAVERDRDHALPWAEMELFSESGLAAMPVPVEYGGAGAGASTLAEVLRVIAVADPSIAQITQIHFCSVEQARVSDSDDLRKFVFSEVLDGGLFGGANTERGGKHAQSIETRIQRDADGVYRLNGEKFYSTGAMFARWINVSALADDGTRVGATVARDAPGLEVLNDWDAIGQRSTSSGTTILEDTPVDDEHVRPFVGGDPASITPWVQIQQAAIDVGIARAAFEDTVSFTRDNARPWVDATGQVREEPGVLERVGALSVKLHAAEALLERAGVVTDRYRFDPTPEHLLDARLVVAEAKTFATDVALEISTVLFELGGTRATLSEHGLDRHWRNARTHTLHNPDRWLRHHLGNWILNGVVPPANAKI
jgi:SfnB family sulfur acquisition oxidoreductase